MPRSSPAICRRASGPPCASLAVRKSRSETAWCGTGISPPSEMGPHRRPHLRQRSPERENMRLSSLISAQPVPNLAMRLGRLQALVSGRVPNLPNLPNLNALAYTHEGGRAYTHTRTRARTPALFTLGRLGRLGRRPHSKAFSLPNLCLTSIEVRNSHQEQPWNR
jgi:hypothetical protein